VSVKACGLSRNYTGLLRLPRSKARIFAVLVHLDPSISDTFIGLGHLDYTYKPLK
jgi:hypothetical protein